MITCVWCLYPENSNNKEMTSGEFSNVFIILSLLVPINSDSFIYRLSHNLYFSCLLQTIFTLVVIDSFLHPILDFHHVSVHSVSSFASTAYSPADDAHQEPLVISDADQGSSAISLACVNLAPCIAGTAHACCNGVSQIVVAFLARVT